MGATSAKKAFNFIRAERARVLWKIQSMAEKDDERCGVHARAEGKEREREVRTQRVGKLSEKESRGCDSIKAGGREGTNRNLVNVIGSLGESGSLVFMSSFIRGRTLARFKLHSPLSLSYSFFLFSPSFARARGK